jgi:hypothetical protein
VISYQHNALGQDIDRIQRYLARRYGVHPVDLPVKQVTDLDYLIDIPDHLSPTPMDMNESTEWATRQNIEVTKYDKASER